MCVKSFRAFLETSTLHKGNKCSNVCAFYRGWVALNDEVIMIIACSDAWWQCTLVPPFFTAISRVVLWGMYTGRVRLAWMLLQSISKQRKLVSLNLQCVWLCGRSPACHANDPSSIFIHTSDILLFILFAHFCKTRSLTLSRCYASNA